MGREQEKVKGKIYYSRVDIELINEQVKLFYSALDEITIEYDDGSFKTLEYVQLGLGSPTKILPIGRNGDYIFGQW